MIQTTKLELKSIQDILGKRFFIASYQRGYRWDIRQVEELLEDITEFAENKKQANDFYSLQPIVVKPHQWKSGQQHVNGYTVIDGQQRLTTVFLILKLLHLKFEHETMRLYTLQFEMRKQSEHYLQNLTLNTRQNEENIDFFYLSRNFHYISEWFGEKMDLDVTFLEKIYPVLMHSVKCILYEVDQAQNEIDVFTRLNSGKIPLTNAELIKALFLLQLSNEHEKFVLASQWDDIEFKLQDNIFFSFIHRAKFNKATRIEFIFDLLVEEFDMEMLGIQNVDDKFTFLVFNRLIQDRESVMMLWEKTKRYFMVFEELYQDNYYYHMVGFLVHNGVDIKEIVALFLTHTKKVFASYLKNYVYRHVRHEKALESLDYTDSKEYKKIRKILFLFNVISMMKRHDVRYPFNLHREEVWSLEHIHAQNTESITKLEDRKYLLMHERPYVSEGLQEEIDEMIQEDEIEDEAFNTLQERIFLEYGDGIECHTIDNLVLLSRNNNSVLNNSIFPVKRERIKNLVVEGYFIPIGTRNVFSKYYSDDVKEVIRWNKKDREGYLEAIKMTLGEYMEQAS